MGCNSSRKLSLDKFTFTAKNMSSIQSITLPLYFWRENSNNFGAKIQISATSRSTQTPKFAIACHLALDT